MQDDADEKRRLAKAEYAREYRKKNKEKLREYHSRPDVKARKARQRAELRRDPSVKEREYQAVVRYRKTPGGIAARKRERSKRCYDPSYAREWKLKNKYGITQEQFVQYCESRDWTCEVCLESMGDSNAIDHDHETGEVRGVICRKCNRAIGMLGDDEESLKRALFYLQTKPFQKEFANNADPKD